MDEVKPWGMANRFFSRAGTAVRAAWTDGFVCRLAADASWGLGATGVEFVLSLAETRRDFSSSVSEPEGLHARARGGTLPSDVPATCTSARHVQDCTLRVHMGPSGGDDPNVSACYALGPLACSVLFPRRDARTALTPRQEMNSGIGHGSSGCLGQEAMMSTRWSF